MVGTLNRIRTTLAAAELEEDERVVLGALTAAGYGRNGSPLGRDGSLTANELATFVYPLMYTSEVDDEAEMAERMETCKRRLRRVVNQLIIKHGISICCEAGAGGGYYLPASDEEVEANHARFHRRAMTGLVKASRARKSAYADAIIQLTMGFDLAADEMRERYGIPRGEDDGPPPWVTVVTKLLGQMKGDPARYAAEIRKIQDEFGDIFVRRDQVCEIRRLSSELSRVLEGLG